jgi:hypothetical protein
MRGQPCQGKNIIKNIISYFPLHEGYDSKGRTTFPAGAPAPAKAGGGATEATPQMAF